MRPSFLLRFVDPGHLYRFEDLLAAVLRVVIEAFQGQYPVVQVGEANRQRIDVRVLVVQRLGDLYYVCLSHGASVRALLFCDAIA